MLLTMFITILIGASLLLVTEKLELDFIYREMTIFVAQFGISSIFVTINVAVLILVTSNHRVKLFSMLASLYIFVYFTVATLVEVSNISDWETVCLLVCASLGILLS